MTALDPRSSGKGIPGRYRVDPRSAIDLSDAGFDVGVHGPHYERRDLESCSAWRQRLPSTHDPAQQWNKVGSRSAAMNRDRDSIRSPSFDYDSPWPNTVGCEPAEPSLPNLG